MSFHGNEVGYNWINIFSQSQENTNKPDKQQTFPEHL